MHAPSFHHWPWLVHENATAPGSTYSIPVRLVEKFPGTSTKEISGYPAANPEGSKNRA